MPFEWVDVPSFGGGLSFENPLTIRDDQWSWSDGWFPHLGAAEVCRPFAEQLSGSWLPASHTIVGMCPNYVTPASNVLIAIINNATSAVRLYLTDGTAPVEKAVSGTAPTGRGLSIVTTAFLNERQILSFGRNTASNYNLATYDGTNFARIAPTQALNADFTTTASSRVLAANVYNGATTLPRTLYVSDAGSYSVWDPATSNSADQLDMWSWGEITGMVPVGEGAVVGTGDTLYALTSTGGIPPFTVRVAEKRGVPTSSGSNHLIVDTPEGIFYDSADDIYRLGGGAVGTRIYPYFYTASTVPMAKALLWHPTRPGFGSLIIGRTSSTLYETTNYNVRADAWWRQTVTTSSQPRAHDVSPPPTADGVAIHWLLTEDGRLYNNTSGAIGLAHTGAYVQTKDFAFGSPPRPTYIDRIRVEWETISNNLTDALVVQHNGRRDFSPSTIAGSEGFETNDLSFTTVGTLTAGVSELPIRQKAKIHRFQFVQSSGRVRIRKFSLRVRLGGDKVA